MRQAVPGGIGRYVEGLLAHLGPAGIEVVRFDGNAARYELWHRMRRLPPPRAARGAALIHAPSLAIPPAGRRSLVVTVHDLAFLTHPGCFTPRGLSFHRRALGVARREAEAVIVPSRHTGDELIDAGFQPSRIHVAHHGIDEVPATVGGDRAEALRSAGVRPGAPYLLFVGTIEPRKGIDTLLAAFESLHGAWPEVRLVVAGPTGWGDEIDLDRAGVIAPNLVPDATLDALYRDALALVLPSRTEGFGLPALEAMARGCPVVCSARGALPEVVGDAGMVVAGAERDAAALAGALESLVGDDAARSELAARGRRRAAGFTWAASMEAHRRAYTAATT